jgi:muramoyltetrapeptide carboxypeptidase
MLWTMKIAVVAPSCTLRPDAAEAVAAIVEARGDAELAIHPQCYLSDGHFAGPDEARLAALRDVMADSSVEAVWFARGGYGSNRIAEAAVADLPPAACSKTYLGYSDAGFLLAAFHKAGLRVAHGPMVQDIARTGGEEAIHRVLDWLVTRDQRSLEPGLKPELRAMAFNLTVLSNLIGTPIEPDFAGAELLIEDVAEHEYRIDRAMFHITNSPAVRNVASLRMGRMSDIP